MNPSAIIKEAMADGVTLALCPAGTIKASGEAHAVNRWLPILKAHKPGILATLREAANEAMTASRWWRLHFPDREPGEVACFPDARHAEILERYPEAIAAEPFDLATPEPERACSTCAHRPPGWLAIEVAPCGDPVAAGLSDLEGVIRYHPNQGADCPAWLWIPDGELERRILAMAEQEAFEERAAIMEYDGGLSREKAERAAARPLKMAENGRG